LWSRVFTGQMHFETPINSVEADKVLLSNEKFYVQLRNVTPYNMLPYIASKKYTLNKPRFSSWRMSKFYDTKIQDLM